MKRSVLPLSLFLLSWLATTAAQAEVQIAWERVEPAAATTKFQFHKIPAPSQTDAATNARFKLVAGREDAHSGDLDILHDGSLPAYDDQPDHNFYFEAGTPGGRILVDLGSPTKIEQIHTYSWHAAARGPQVYRLYASNAAEAPPATAATDLAQAGWQLLGSVDTRPHEGAANGQYGVSISAPVGGAIGTYRHLLFDVVRTTAADRFDNTFFSEIDVLDGKEHTATPRDIDDVVINFDVSETPELKPWVDAVLRPACKKWYPIIVRMLPSDGYHAPRHFSVVFLKNMQGVAETTGSRVRCGAPWFRENLDGEAAGAVIHELVHVVQQYGHVPGGNPSPVWLVEGVADYVRWFHYEPEALRPHPDPAHARYTDGYRNTAAFLTYAAEKHDKDLVKKLNDAMRKGRYTPDLWKQYTGQTLDALWDEYVKTLQPPKQG